MEFTRNNNLPQKGDKLFIREQIGTSWLPTGVDDYFKLSEGYRMATVAIYEEIKKSEWMYKPFLTCSMIFCFRQFLEVRLKELVFFGKKELFETPDFLKEHNLYNLYNDYVVNVLPKIDANYDKNLADIVKGLIVEFNNVDPQSMTFRYLVDKKLQSVLSMPNIDIDNFKTVMDKLSNYFDAQLELVCLLESYNDEMAQEYASYMYQAMC